MTAFTILPPDPFERHSVAVSVDLSPSSFFALADEATRLGVRLPAYVGFIINREAARLRKVQGTAASDLTTSSMP